MKLGDPIYYYTRGDGPFIGIITEVLQANMINATIFPPGAASYPVGCVMTEGGPVETWQTLNNCWATPVAQAATIISSGVGDDQAEEIKRLQWAIEEIGKSVKQWVDGALRR